MKKLLSIALALMMVLSLFSVALADDVPTVSVFLHIANTGFSNDLIFKTVEEKFGIKFEWIASQYHELIPNLNKYYAADNLPDFFLSIEGCTSTLFRNMIEEGMVTDLTPYLESGNYPNLVKYLTETDPSFEHEIIDGKWYGIPRYYEPKYPQSLYYRADLLEKLGLEAPTTVEELADVIEKVVAADPDGNHIQGMFFYLKSYDWLCQPFTGTVSWLKYEDTGKIEKYFVRPEYRDFLIYVNNLWKKGLIDPDMVANVEGAHIEKFAAGQVFCTWNNFDANLYNPYYNTLLESYPDAVVKILDPITGPAGTYVNTKEQGYDGCMAISSKVPPETVEKIMALCDWVVSPEGRETAMYGIEGVHYKVVDGQKVRIEEGFEADKANVSNIWALGVHRVNQLVESYFSHGPLPTVDRYDELVGYYDAIRAGTPAKVTWLHQFTSQNKVDFEAGVKDCVAEYLTKFIIGTLDPNSDDDWNTYLKALDQAGYYLIEADVNEWMKDK